MKYPAHYRGDYPEDIWVVLQLAWHTGLSIQGDHARQFAPEVALAASCGWISTITPNGREYGNRWKITAAGLSALQHKDLFNA